jgi:hypothetical protein
VGGGTAERAAGEAKGMRAGKVSSGVGGTSRRGLGLAALHRLLGGANKGTSHVGKVIRNLGRRNRGKRGRSSSDRNRGSESHRGQLQFAKDGLCNERFLGTDKNEIANGSDADRTKGSKLG